MEISLKLYKALEEKFNYNIVNKQPLTTIPNAKMVLYSVDNGIGFKLFSTLEERLVYLKNNKSSYQRLLTIGYIGNVADKDNVIKIDYEDNNVPQLLSIIDKDSYYVYDFDESKKRGKYIWNIYMGDLRHIYEEFENKSNLNSVIKFR